MNLEEINCGIKYSAILFSAFKTLQWLWNSCIDSDKVVQQSSTWSYKQKVLIVKLNYIEMRCFGPIIGGLKNGLVWYLGLVLTSIPELFAKAPTGWTWSYKIITPTITRKQNNLVCSLSNLTQYSLKRRNKHN